MAIPHGVVYINHCSEHHLYGVVYVVELYVLYPVLFRMVRVLLGYHVTSFNILCFSFSFFVKLTS